MGSKELRSVSPLLRRIRFCFKKLSIARLIKRTRPGGRPSVAYCCFLGLGRKSSLPWPHVEITATYEYCIMGQVDDAPPHLHGIWISWARLTRRTSADQGKSLTPRAYDPINGALHMSRLEPRQNHGRVSVSVCVKAHVDST